MAVSQEFLDHLRSGNTRVCRCWSIVRRDGLAIGFTDHDLALTFDGLEFLPNSGMTARSLEQTSGLSVDNTEALGVLSADAVTEGDILAGRYDGAEVNSWLVNWTDVAERTLQFKGTIGEIRRGGGAFQAELRGLTESLNQPQGRVYQKSCTAILGDADCQFDVDQVGFSTVVTIDAVRDRKFLDLNLDGFEERWFERGRATFQTGAATGLIALIKNDRFGKDTRTVELWEDLRADIQPGDTIRLEAGCDRRRDTCRFKFDNFLNFQGFPGIPGEDWLMSVPRRGDANDGGSLSE